MERDRRKKQMDKTTDRDLKEREEKGAEKKREGGRAFVVG